MKIQLDVKALTKLIESDDDFAVELKRGVLAQVIRKTYEKDAGAILEDMVPKALKELKKNGKLADAARTALEKEAEKQISFFRSTYGWDRKWELKPSTKKKMDEALESVIRQYHKEFEQKCHGELVQAYDEVMGRVESKIEESISKIEQRIENRINRNINLEVDKRVDEKIANALSKV